MSHFKLKHGDKMSQYNHAKQPPSFAQPEVPSQIQTDVKKQKKYVGFSKQYQCSYCPSAFVRQDSLNCHVKQHSESKVQPPGFSMTHNDYPKVITNDSNILMPYQNADTQNITNLSRMRSPNQSVIVPTYSQIQANTNTADQ